MCDGFRRWGRWLAGETKVYRSPGWRSDVRWRLGSEPDGFRRLGRHSNFSLRDDTLSPYLTGFEQPLGLASSTSCDPTACPLDGGSERWLSIPIELKTMRFTETGANDLGDPRPDQCGQQNRNHRLDGGAPMVSKKPAILALIRPRPAGAHLIQRELETLADFATTILIYRRVLGWSQPLYRPDFD